MSFAVVNVPFVTTFIRKYKYKYNKTAFEYVYLHRYEENMFKLRLYDDEKHD